MSAQTLDGRPAKAPRLLIVDDSFEITQLLVVYFHQAGFNTVAAYDGRSALDLLERASPALVILDLGLPDADGLDICRTIRGRSGALPIVALGARGQFIAAETAGATENLAKPFDVEELHLVVRRLLGRR